MVVKPMVSSRFTALSPNVAPHAHPQQFKSTILVQQPAPVQVQQFAPAGQPMVLPPTPQSPPSSPLSPASSANQLSGPWDFFLSHYQLNAGPQMNALYLELKMAGKRAWFDKYNTPSEEGMLDGVARSSVFLLFLTNDIFTRAFCLIEIRHALKLGKPFILLRETEPRYTFTSAGGAVKPTSVSVPELMQDCPDDLKPLFKYLVVKEHRQEGYEREAMIQARAF